ncbi:MAG: hypothetical protein MJ224_01745 [archaeon]|nr:hypothetical protein [archaeon]
MVEDKNQLIGTVNYWKNKYNTDLSDLKAYETKIKANEQLITIMLDLTESVINEVINNTIKAVTNEHNNILSSAGIIKRLKGLELKEPSINKDDVKARELTRLNNSINNKLRYSLL